MEAAEFVPQAAKIKVEIIITDQQENVLFMTNSSQADKTPSILAWNP